MRALTLLAALLIALPGCKSGEPLKSAAFPEFRAQIVGSSNKGDVRREPIGTSGLNARLVPVTGRFKDGGKQLQIVQRKNGDAVELGASVEKFVLDAWLEDVYVRVVPLSKPLGKRRDEEVEEILRTRQGRLVHASLDRATARFEGIARFREVELIWQPSEAAPQEREVAVFVVSTLLVHSGGGFTRQVAVAQVVRPKEGGF